MAMPATAVEVLPVENDPQYQTLAGGALELLEHANGIVITDDQEDAAAKEFLVQVSTARKRWEELRHWFSDPLERQKKAIIARFKADAAPVEEAERIVRAKVAVYYREKQEAARREQERLRKLAEKRQERVVAKAEARGEEAPAPIIPLPTVEAPAKTTRTAEGSVTMRTVWKFEVTDPQAVPREYLIVNEKAIGAVVKAGVRQIPGVRIYEVEEVAVR